MICGNYLNIDEMFSGVTKDLLDSNLENLIINQDGVYAPNVHLTTDSMSTKLDVGRDIWLNRSRWTKLVKEYVSRSKVEEFIHQAMGIMLGRDPLATVGMPFTVPEKTGTRKWWGGCLTAIYFSNLDKPRITLVSRTSYWAATAVIDALIAQRCADRISEGHPDKVQFQWYIGTLNFNYLRAIPFMFSNKQVMRKIIKGKMNLRKGMTLPLPLKYAVNLHSEMKTQLASKGSEKFVADEKYQVFKQIKKKWASIIDGKESRPIPVSELNFNKCPF